MLNFSIILTCYNRKEKTKKCLNSLLSILPNAHIYLVDDNSTDGTSKMIRKEFPKVHIIQGNGNLFWSRGMYTAWIEALKDKYDFYIWLNDDVELYPDFYQELMECQIIFNNNCIVSGIVESFDKKEILYGGSDKTKKRIIPNGIPQDITYMNGNVVLISQKVVDQIGIIDPVYHHDLGDVDYGLRAIKNNIKVITTRKAIAKGYRNNICRVRKWGTNIKERFKRLYSPLGANPRIIFYHRNKHFGFINAFLFVNYLFILNILPDCIISFIWKDKYKESK